MAWPSAGWSTASASPTYLLAYTAAAELISGVPLLDAPDKDTFGRLLNERVVPALGMPGAYTARGRQFDSVVKYLMGADAAGNDLPLRQQGLQRRYLMNMQHPDPDVEKDPRPGARASSTVHVRYRIDPGLGLTEEELNARVRRLRPSKDGRAPSVNPVYAERTGRLTVPLLTLHETGDAWVPLSLEQSYLRRTIAAGTDHLLVQRVMRAGSHCGFHGETREQAFNDLVAWIERGVRPPGEDVLAPISHASGSGGRRCCKCLTGWLSAPYAAADRENRSAPLPSSPRRAS